MKYSAKDAYQSELSASTYENRSMYHGFLGRRRVRTETNVISKMMAEIEPNSSILDCPCGNGRWFSAIAQHAKEIVARDFSVGMSEAARVRASGISIPIDVQLGDAEALDIAKESVDYCFSYALMKHLPIPVQYRVLSEFSRVSRLGVLCSFAVFTPLSYAWWKRRRPVESFPVIREELDLMAASVGLRLVKTIKVSQPFLGLEYFAVFAKLPVSAN